jgi:hypothetical protein
MPMAGCRSGVDHGRNLATEGQVRRSQGIIIEAHLQKESLTMHFNGQDKRTVFEPNRITVQTETGRNCG